MEKDLMGLWVIGVILDGLTVLTPLVILAIVPAILLVLVVADVFCSRSVDSFNHQSFGEVAKPKTPFKISTNCPGRKPGMPLAG